MGSRVLSSTGALGGRRLPGLGFLALEAFRVPGTDDTEPSTHRDRGPGATYIAGMLGPGRGAPIMDVLSGAWAQGAGSDLGALFQMQALRLNTSACTFVGA